MFLFLLTEMGKFMEDKKQYTSISSRQLQNNFTISIALSAAIFQQSQMWLEQIRRFFISNSLIVVSTKLNCFIIITSSGVIPSNRVLTLVREFLTGCRR